MMAKTELLLDGETATGTIRKRFRMLYHSLLALEVVHGAVTGSLSLWASQEDDPSTSDDTAWTELTGITLTDPSGTAGTVLVSESDLPHRWLMLKYVHSSGTGDLTSRATLK